MVSEKTSEQEFDLSFEASGEGIAVTFSGNGGEVSKVLPETYTEVEYLEATGSQYIDTGYIPKANTEIEADIQDDSRGGNVFGTAVTWDAYSRFSFSYDGRNASYGVNSSDKASNNFIYDEKLHIETSGSTISWYDSWNTESDGSGTTYTDEQAVSITADLNLYAQWQKNPVVSYYENKLPSEYQEVEYIESSGTQYIQLPTKATNVETEVKYSQETLSVGELVGDTVGNYNYYNFGTSFQDGKRYFWYWKHLIDV